MSKNTTIWEIIKKKKVNRTILEQAVLDDWVYKWFGTPIRIIIFPVMLLVKLYKRAYNYDD
jgi:hypothetical protein